MTIQSLNKYSNLELALMVVLGYFGNGQERVNKLGSRYKSVQNLVEQIVAGTVPAGSGQLTKAKVKAAVLQVFNEAINEIAKEVENEL